MISSADNALPLAAAVVDWRVRRPAGRPRLRMGRIETGEAGPRVRRRHPIGSPAAIVCGANHADYGHAHLQLVRGRATGSRSGAAESASLIVAAADLTECPGAAAILGVHVLVKQLNPDKPLRLGLLDGTALSSAACESGEEQK